MPPSRAANCDRDLSIQIPKINSALLSRSRQKPIFIPRHAPPSDHGGVFSVEPKLIYETVFCNELPRHRNTLADALVNATSNLNTTSDLAENKVVASRLSSNHRHRCGCTRSDAGVRTLPNLVLRELLCSARGELHEPRKSYLDERLHFRTGRNTGVG